ncbi:MAG TPA: AAA family ATPase, partial [Oscillospiraceae bacterium]|nr:AAA family ATPase [Oscillospiraceae bacterium]
MLSELQIENLAVIEYANLTLGENLNIFTGETGAGKSILIHGINAILGQRMSKEIVRTGAQTAIVTASFINLPDEVKEKLIEQGYNSDDDKLVIRREINESGKGSVKINDKVATNAFLREVTLNIVNIHGQHDSQILLAPEKHLAILDSFAGIDDQLSSYKNNFRSLQEIARKIQKLTMTEVEKLQTEEILQYQINEIESLKIKPDEDIALERELAIMRNSTQVFELLKRSYDNLNGIDDTPGAAELARSTADMVAELLEFMP